MKNFQICHYSDPEHIIMQLGRVDTNVFHMDFRFLIVTTWARSASFVIQIFPWLYMAWP